MLEQESAEAALELLGNVLAGRGLAYEVVVVGGSALLLRGLIRRPTNDIDVIAFVVNDEYVSANPMPDDILQAVADVADAMGLAPNWLNNGPTS